MRMQRIAETFLLAAVLACNTALAIDKGAPAPAVALARVDNGQPYGLADLKGRVVLVDFWASWCSPCREAMPQYDALRKEFSRDAFEILAINLDEEKADADAYLVKHPVSYPVVLDPQGDSAKAFGLIGMPSSYLIDRAGRVHSSHTGFKSKDIADLRKAITELAGADHAP